MGVGIWGYLNADFSSVTYQVSPCQIASFDFLSDMTLKCLNKLDKIVFDKLILVIMVLRNVMVNLKNKVIIPTVYEI
uniref:Uncharacterized protein n=1 Tax=Solanum lycopersicum TaxID=4081 RepID=A0A3Q7EQD9_SOLLC